jgi:hypothetical protein
MRECIDISVRSLRLQGTFHIPAGAGSLSEENANRSSRLGVVFFNSGFLPRAPQGDVTVHQADCIASLGYHAFRFDMPGLGDSEGELAENALTVVRQIQAGEHAPFAAELAAELKARFDLKGIIRAGHCGGAITSIYAAEALRGADIHGVMVFEPDFRLRVPGQSEPPKWQLVYSELRAWLLKSGGSTLMQFFHSFMKKNVRFARFLFSKARRRGLQLVRIGKNKKAPSHPVTPSKPAVPLDANHALIKAWKALLGRNFPVLLVTVPQAASAKEGDDFFENLLRQPVRFLTHVKVTGTNHAFVEGEGRREVTEITEQWLREHFPSSPRLKIS